MNIICGQYPTVLEIFVIAIIFVLFCWIVIKVMGVILEDKYDTVHAKDGGEC